MCESLMNHCLKDSLTQIGLYPITAWISSKKMMLDVNLMTDNLPTNYYDDIMMVSRLRLEYRKIDCCSNEYMVFYNNEFSINDGSLS